MTVSPSLISAKYFSALLHASRLSRQLWVVVVDVTLGLRVDCVELDSRPLVEARLS